MTLREALVPPLAAGAVRALGATLRLREEGVEALQPLWAAGQPLIYAVWHGRILMVPWVNARLRRTRGARCVRVLASRSRDGELAARLAARFGLSVVRGSSSRSGGAALRELTTAVRGGEDVAVVPDGPRGPRERVQAGIIVLAAATGAPFARSFTPAQAEEFFPDVALLPADLDREYADLWGERANLWGWIWSGEQYEVSEFADRLVDA